jgi:hypothetical protein
VFHITHFRYFLSVKADQFRIDFMVVLVKYLGEDGYVCANGWTQTAAQVLCRQNGYSYGGSIGSGSAVNVQNVKPIWMNDITCSGMEKSLDECTLGRPKNHTNCTKYAEIKCGKLQ